MDARPLSPREIVVREEATRLSEEAFREAKGYAAGRQDAEFGMTDAHAVLDFAAKYKRHVFLYHAGCLRMCVPMREAYAAWARGAGF